MNADPLLMAVAVGSSCAFLTPIGHQSNLLVMGPGGYRFADYWRLGLPVSVAVLLAGMNRCNGTGAAAVPRAHGLEPSKGAIAAALLPLSGSG